MASMFLHRMRWGMRIPSHDPHPYRPLSAPDRLHPCHTVGNEWQRAQLGAPEGAKIHGAGTAATCRWNGHDATSSLCLCRHGGLPPAFRAAIQPGHLGVLGALSATGNYQMANLVLLAVAWPVLAWINWHQKRAKRQDAVNARGPTDEP